MDEAAIGELGADVKGSGDCDGSYQKAVNIEVSKVASQTARDESARIIRRARLSSCCRMDGSIVVPEAVLASFDQAGAQQRHELAQRLLPRHRSEIERFVEGDAAVQSREQEGLLG